MLATTALKLIATSSSCTGALPGSWRDRHGGIGQEGLAGGGPDLAALNVGCGRGCARCPPSPPLPTPRLHFIYSVFALVTGWAWTLVPRMCAELHPTLHPLHTCPVPSVCSPPPSLGPEQPLTPGQKSLWLSPYHPIHTDRDSNTPPPILSKCVHQDGFVAFLWGGAVRVQEVGTHSELRDGQAVGGGSRFPKSPDILKFREWSTRASEPLGLLATCQIPVPRPASPAEIVSPLAVCPTAEKELGKKVPGTQPAAAGRTV